MPSFDAIEVRRPQLAQGYLALLQAQPGRPLALFAPRRVGKTHFLDHDLGPASRDAGKLPVYADLWLHKSAPLDAVNHALEEALDDLLVPAGSIGQAAKTPVRKIGAFGASIDLGEAPARRSLPPQPALRLDALSGGWRASTRARCCSCSTKCRRWPRPPTAWPWWPAGAPCCTSAAPRSARFSPARRRRA